MTKQIITLILTFSLACGSTPYNTNIGEGLFTDCTEQPSDNGYSTLEHELFSIEYPISWDEDNKLKQGLDISSYEFADSLKRGFMLSVVPYQHYYLKKNSQIKYHRFEEGTYSGYDAIFLIRNDLRSVEGDDFAYWRCEFKIVNKKKDLVYYLIFGRAHNKEKEPTWCEFEQMITSFKIKE